MIHETASVESKTPASVTVWRFTHIREGCTIRPHCSFGQSVYVGPNSAFGSHCRIQNNVFIPENSIFGSHVFVGPGTVFTNTKKPDLTDPAPAEYEPPLVGKGAAIGANCTILPGVTINKWALIGAGSVVTRSVPAYAIVYGNPARIHSYKDI
jgi:UDP-2-acetamido-3-amino-2,3-dideoxy-glucuronate N-acetyltransferase